nr:immunoglobulin light chain junction region [Macaca mulatta]
CLQGYNTPWTF